MLKARFVLIFLFVGVGAAAIFGGAWLYLRPEPAPPPKRAAAPKPKPLPVVLTASKDLKVGSLITATDIVWAPLKNGAILSAHMLKGKAKPAHVIGAVVRREVFNGTPLTWSSIVRPGQYGFLAAALRPDHRAVTIGVNRATSQAGLIYPGDRVDVILTVQVKEGQARGSNTFTATILEDIRVIAVDRQVEGNVSSQGQLKKLSRGDSSTVTLEVLPLEAERLVLATDRGKISLAMRSLTDGQRRDNHTPTAFKDLLALPAVEDGLENPAASQPRAAAPAPAPARGDPEPVRVQIFRGSAREEVLLKR